MVRSDTGDEVVACSKAGDVVAVCSGAGIEDDSAAVSGATEGPELAVSKIC
jgi:hypothetical protein